MITRPANVTLLAEEYDEAIQWHCEKLGLERGKPKGAQAFLRTCTRLLTHRWSPAPGPGHGPIYGTIPSWS